MGIDDHIFELENSIEVFKKKIKNFDESVSQAKYHSLPYFKTNNSQLPFELQDFESEGLSGVIRDHLIHESCNALSKKVIPMPGLEANFCYDFLKNVYIFKGPMQLIYGLGNTSEASFEEILGLVVSRNKQRFQDIALCLVGKEDRVVTKPILLENGNTIIEEYNFVYHKGDYEKRSPVLLQGKTKLVSTRK